MQEAPPAGVTTERPSRPPIATPQAGRALTAAPRPGVREVLLVIAAAAVVGAAAGAGKRPAELLLALFGIFLYGAFAASRLRAAVILLFASLALVPVYVFADFHRIAPEPAAIAGIVLTLVLVRANAEFRLTSIDVMFALLCLAMQVGAVLGPLGPLGNAGDLFYWIPAYLAGRAIAVRVGGAHLIALGAAITGLISLPFIVNEFLTGTNIFFNYANPDNQLSAQWAHPVFRGGVELRTQGAFGHPLSMAMIVASAAVFAFALAFRASDRTHRIAWLAAGVALVGAQSTSGERTGWMIVIGGLLLFAATAIPTDARVRYGFAGAMVGLPLLLVAFALLGNSSSTDSSGAAAAARADSTEYRVNLYKHALDPGALTFIGLGDQSGQFSARVNLGTTSIDSAFLQIGARNGLIALIPFLGVLIALIRTLVRVRGTWSAVVPAVAFANMLGLFVVGFQTQQPIFIWLLIGAASGVALAAYERQDVRRMTVPTTATEAAEPELLAGDPAEPSRPGRSGLRSLLNAGRLLVRVCRSTSHRPRAAAVLYARDRPQRLRRARHPARQRRRRLDLFSLALETSVMRQYFQLAGSPDERRELHRLHVAVPRLLSAGRHGCPERDRLAAAPFGRSDRRTRRRLHAAVDRVGIGSGHRPADCPPGPRRPARLPLDDRDHRLRHAGR